MANHALVALWTLVAFYLLIIGGEWINESLGTLALALKMEPLFVGLVFSALFGVLPITCLIAAFSWTGQNDAALGLVLGGGWFFITLPTALAALNSPLSVRPSWSRVDIPLGVVYLIIFTLFCVFGLSWEKGVALAGMAAAFVGLKYINGKESRYGLGAFGRSFMFGSSIISVFLKLLCGGLVIAMGCWYLLLLSKTLSGAEAVPAMALGFLAALPFCVPEIVFALAAAKKGQGELVLGRGLWMGILVLLIGGAIMGYRALQLDADLFSFIPVAFVMLMLILWGFLRFSDRLWRWQAWLLLIATIACTVTVWAQGYGYLYQLALPRNVTL